MPSEPDNKGYLPPPVKADLSPAASAVRSAAVLSTISAYNLASKPRAIRNQQDVPCCVSCALAGAMEVVHPEWPRLAPLFHYYVTRYDNGRADSTGSVTLADAIVTLTNQGVCRHDLHPLPYTLNAAERKPSESAYGDVLDRRILRRGYFFLYRQFTGTSRAAWIREQLRQNCPVVVGLRRPEGYPDKFLDRKFEWQDPENPAPQQGGHCVLILGYDDTRTALRIQDSQGAARFDGGRWWMGYRVADSIVVEEAYSLIP